MTEYTVLHQGAENGWWPVGQYAARSARSAVQSAMIALPDKLGKGGEFVAVPERSWKPVTVDVETKTQLKFS